MERGASNWIYVEGGFEIEKWAVCVFEKRGVTALTYIWRIAR